MVSRKYLYDCTYVLCIHIIQSKNFIGPINFFLSSFYLPGLVGRALVMLLCLSPLNRSFPSPLVIILIRLSREISRQATYTRRSLQLRTISWTKPDRGNASAQYIYYVCIICIRIVYVCTSTDTYLRTPYHYLIHRRSLWLTLRICTLYRLVISVISIILSLTKY